MPKPDTSRPRGELRRLGLLLRFVRPSGMALIAAGVALARAPAPAQPE